MYCHRRVAVDTDADTSEAPLCIVGDSFGVSCPGELSWYLVAFSLTVGTFILLAGTGGEAFFLVAG